MKMGKSREDDEDKTLLRNSNSNREFGVEDTQPVDDEFCQSPLPEFGEEPGFEYVDEDYSYTQCIQDTVPVDETLPNGDIFETQLVNLHDQTQQLNPLGDTQVLDSYDFTEDICTQLLDDFNADVHADDHDEGSDKTEILLDTQEVSDDDSVSSGGFINNEEVPKPDQCNDYKVLAQSDAPSHVQNHSGSRSAGTGFTAVRTASIRSSGFAARKATESQLSSVNADNASFKDQDASKSARIFYSECSKENCWENDELVNVSWIETGGRIVSSAVRKLFAQDVTSDCELPANVANYADNMADAAELSAGNHELAGLSYVDSQEPGEASQANALDFVDRFVEKNVVDIEEDVDLGRPPDRKGRAIPLASGSRSLAKRASRHLAGGGIFDWDNDREDEGGGEFFQKKKELFFDHRSQRSKRKFSTEPRNSKYPKSLDGGIVEHLEEKKTHPNFNMKLKALANSDSKLMKRDSRVPGESLQLRNEECARDLNEQLNTASTAGIVSDGTDCRSNLEMLDIGIDTQMAAEAIESLCCGVDTLDNGGDNLKEKAENRTGDPSNIESSSCKCSGPRSFGRVGSGGSAVVRNRRSKRAKRAGFKVDNGCTPSSNMEGVEVDCNKARLNMEKSMIMQGNKHASCLSSLSLERKEERVSLASDAEKILAGCFSTKKHFDKQLDTISPIAHRTRKSTEMSHLKRVRHETEKSVGVGERKRKKVDAESFNAKGKVDVRSNGRVETVQDDQCKTPPSACTTLLSPNTPMNDASPICKGDEYWKQSCRKSFKKTFLMKEINGLLDSGPTISCSNKGLRRRREMTSVQVLFSQHLDADTIKQQKKILVRLGASAANSISEATHFVTDSFVRTRNMLEAIASGKPVVTSSWLESCAEACCLIDEKKFILRDSRKEKEFGFSMPVSLGRACEHPLLQGFRVLITLRTKPGKEVLSSLVKAVHGLVIERLQRSLLKDEKFPDDVLILSCEEDYEFCLPLLEKGAAIYSSELLLNGIVTQKLDYERHRLFTEQLKRGRYITRKRKMAITS